MMSYSPAVCRWYLFLHLGEERQSFLSKKQHDNEASNIPHPMITALMVVTIMTVVLKVVHGDRNYGGN